VEAEVALFLVAPRWQGVGQINNRFIAGRKGIRERDNLNNIGAFKGGFGVGFAGVVDVGIVGVPVVEHATLSGVEADEFGLGWVPIPKWAAF
jgi:hypothetical protein